MASVRAIAVGAFVIGGMALAVLAVLFFGNLSSSATTTRAVIFFKDSVAGLSVGAPVTIRGVRVGSVENIKLQIDQRDVTALIAVYIGIDRAKIDWTNVISPTPGTNIPRAVQGGLRAELGTESLVTGQLSVNLDFRPDTPIILVGDDKSVPEIPALPSDIDRLKDTLSKIDLPDLSLKARATLVSIQAIADQLKNRVGPLALSAQETSDAARATLETTTAAVRQLQIQSVKTLLDIDQLAIESRHQVAVNGKTVDEVLKNTARDTAAAEKLLISLNEMTAPYSPMRADLAASLRDLAASADSLREFSRNLERHPAAALLTGGSK